MVLKDVQRFKDVCKTSNSARKKEGSEKSAFSSAAIHERPQGRKKLKEERKRSREEQKSSKYVHKERLLDRLDEMNKTMNSMKESILLQYLPLHERTARARSLLAKGADEVEQERENENKCARNLDEVDLIDDNSSLSDIENIIRN